VLIPLSVDGMVVASSMSILLASRSGRRADVLPWLLLAVGSLASLAANVAVAEPTLVGRLIAAWPSFAFVGAYELLQGQLRAAHRRLGIGEAELPCAAVGQAADDGEGDEQEEPGPCRRIGRRLQRQAWEWALCNRTPAGDLPSGNEIAEAFGRKERWGRLVKQAGQAGAFGQADVQI
jgi:hypothetical protein